MKDEINTYFQTSEVMKITIIGATFEGLITAACLAEIGHSIICTDPDPKKIEDLNKGILPLYEEGLDVLIRTNLIEGRLRFLPDIPTSINQSDIIFLCSGDLLQVENALQILAEQASGYKLVVLKSPVPVQTAEKFVILSHKSSTDAHLEIVSNPDFLHEGTAIYDAMHPDRIIIGVSSNKAAGIMTKLFEPLNAPILVMDNASAELIKFASNSFLAMKISFINAMEQICEEVGANIKHVIRGMGLDKRIGDKFLSAGLGYGGSFFPKDVDAMIQFAARQNIDFKLLKEVQNINLQQRERMIRKVEMALNGNLKGKNIAILGLSFKAGTDDLRHSPAIYVAEKLIEKGCHIQAYDPVANEKAKPILPPSVTFFDDPYEASEGAHVLLVCTDWNEIRNIDLLQLKQKMINPILIDGRNLFDPIKMESLGYEYYSYGQTNLQETNIHLIKSILEIEH